MHKFKQMKLIIAGSRVKYLSVGQSMMEHICLHFNFHKNNVEEIVSGVSEGVDEKGSIWARERGIPVEKFPADWDEYGKAAGPIRNKEMAKYADALLLIWNGESPGSKDMLNKMRVRGKPVYEVLIREPKS